MQARQKARAGEFQAAEADYTALLKHHNHNPALFYERARVLARLGQHEAALTDLEQMMNLVNDNASLFDSSQMIRNVGRLIYRVEPALGELFAKTKADYPDLDRAADRLIAVEDMVTVEAGPFEMGSEDGWPDEKPVHTVTLEAFEIDRYEVTNAEYAACVDADGCRPPADTGSNSRDRYSGQAEYNDYPVVYWAVI